MTPFHHPQTSTLLSVKICGYRQCPSTIETLAVLSARCLRVDGDRCQVSMCVRMYRSVKGEGVESTPPALSRSAAAVKLQSALPPPGRRHCVNRHPAPSHPLRGKILQSACYRPIRDGDFLKIGLWSGRCWRARGRPLVLVIVVVRIAYHLLKASSNDSGVHAKTIEDFESRPAQCMGNTSWTPWPRLPRSQDFCRRQGRLFRMPEKSAPSASRIGHWDCRPNPGGGCTNVSKTNGCRPGLKPRTASGQ
ncbi:hypothetical protein B0T14DRAFT_264701 [Immersiella caudata]|uniref:Uncharacterized protein n=1 Tax=Immersiella caudata TaxID=314043 RepID=A0AA39WKX0_9PEZI|nr:hypothetical protein B0T14DRAFT_264701 [Immersiella caudata]